MTTLEARFHSRAYLFSAMGGKGGGAQRALLHVYMPKETDARSAAKAQ
jgi:hypothetical protein